MVSLGYLVFLLVATRQRTNPFAFLFVVACILAALGYLTYWLFKIRNRYLDRREFRRSYEILRALSPHGMRLGASTSSAARLALLEPFELGRRLDSHMVKHFMESTPESGDVAWMMDYWYFARANNDRVWWHVTVALVECGVELPHFILSKELPLEWLQRLRKLQDFDFPEHPKFNKLFRLTGEDEAAVRSLFSAPVRNELERHPGLTIEARGSQLLIFRRDVTLPPDKWPEFLTEALGIAKLFVG